MRFLQVQAQGSLAGARSTREYYPALPSLPPCSHLPCRAPAQTAVLVKKLRQALDALLERKVRSPGARLEEAGGAALIQSLVDLLNHEEASQKWDR